MKHLLTLLILFMIHVDARCQSITVRLYGNYSCTNGVKQLMSFGLVKEGTTYSVDDASGVLVLSESGNYTLSYVLDEIDTTQLGKIYSIEVTDETFSDTLNMITITPCLEPTSHPRFIGYCCCDDKCEGNQVDYYSNGNKRIAGYFKEGVPQGELTIYYPSGKLRQVDKYNKKGHLKKRVFYNEKGDISASETY